MMDRSLKVGQKNVKKKVNKHHGRRLMRTDNRNTNSKMHKYAPTTGKIV